MVNPIPDGYPRISMYLCVDGATAQRPVEDQFYGDRSGQFEDPWGHRWGVASHIDDVDDDEIARRAAAMMSGDEH